MIVAVRGQVQRREASALVLRVGPVDLRVLVPSPTAAGASEGGEVELAVYLYLRQDQIALYGFESAAVRDAFQLLLGVSGVGPKGALALLSVFEASELRRAIVRGDSKALSRAPGIGARVASRIVAELQPKLLAQGEPTADRESDSYSQALGALMGMGYSPQEARDALEGIGTDGSLEERLRSALAFLADRRAR